MTTAKEQIPVYLDQCSERKSTADIANALDYSTGHVLNTCKELRDDDVIQGKKTGEGALAIIIRGDFVVLTSYRPKLVSLVETYAKGHFEDPEEVPTEDLIRFLRDQVADEIVGPVSKPWQWWR